MSEWRIIGVIFTVGAVSYALRAGGFLAAGAMPQSGVVPRLLRLAPGNLFVAFAAAGISAGGLPALLASVATVGAMAATGREWVALLVGFVAAALVSVRL
jgi:branched-subunit amino acid transport protein